MIIRIVPNNDGDANATGVAITNTIPTSAIYVTGSANQGGAETETGSGAITWFPTTIPLSSAITHTFQFAVNGPLTNGDKLTNIISVHSAEGINIENLAQVKIVGLRSTYLPILYKN